MPRPPTALDKVTVVHLDFWELHKHYPQQNMADTCIAPNGEPMWTFGLGSKTKTMILAAIIACLPLTTFLLGPKLLFYVGGTLGYYLKKKTTGRRAQILEMVEADEKAFLAKGRDRRDSDEWENVESYATGSARNGEAGDAEWDGFVGFFHPFWYGFYILDIMYG
jgi:alpha-1,2-mannosyltransferase